MLHTERNPFFTRFVLFTSASLCFLLAIGAEFAFDDNEAIVNNVDLKLNTPFVAVFQSDFWGTKLSSNASHKSFRPFTIITFRLLKYLNNDTLNPAVFHSANVVIHGLASCLREEQILPVHLNTPFLTSLLFAVHPIHTEAVCAAVGLSDLMSSLFAVLSLQIFFVSKAHSFTDVFVSTVLAIAFAGISMLFKEQGITVLGVCSVFDCISLHNHFRGLSKRQHWKLILLRIAIISFGICILLYYRLYVIDFKAPAFHDVDNPASFLESTFLRMINYHYIYTLNAWITIFPVWLCFDWSMGCVPLIKSYSDLRISAVVIFWTLFLILFCYAFCCVNNQIRSRLQVCFTLILVPFLPMSNLFFRVGFVIAERNLYLPSIGFCLLVASGHQLLSAYFFKYTSKIRLLFYYLCLIFASRSINRSFDWISEQRLFNSGLNVCPLNAKVHYNIAKLAAMNGNKNIAVNEYFKAITLNPNYYFAMNNLANILKDQNRTTEAKLLLERATSVKPDFAVAWMNLGIVLTSLKRYKDAENSYFNALKHRQKYTDCLFNLGNLYLEEKRYNDASIAWRKALHFKPDLIHAWNNLILMLDSVGDLKGSLAVAEEALRHVPGDSSLHFNNANILGKLNRFEDAEKHFLIAISLDPIAVHYANLGVLYHRWKKYSKAKIAYEKALSLNPDLETTRQNFNQLIKN